MLDPVSLSLAAGGAILPEVLRFIEGQKMKKQGREIADSLHRPTMTIQNENQEALDITRMLAGSRDMPGYSTAKSDIEGTFANAIGQTQRTGTPDVAALYGAKMKALTGLNDQAAAFRERNVANLVAELHNMGAQKQALFDFNKVRPYYEDADAARRLQEAGLQNTFSAVENVGSGLVDTAQLIMMNNYLNG